MMRRAEITQSIQRWVGRKADHLEGVPDPFTRLPLLGFQRIQESAQEVPALRPEPQTEWDVVVSTPAHRRTATVLAVRRYLPETPLLQVVDMVFTGPFVLFSGVSLARAEAVRADLSAAGVDVEVVYTP